MLYEPLDRHRIPDVRAQRGEDHYDAAHHPFTSPMDEDLELFQPGRRERAEHDCSAQVRAKAYDAVINGIRNAPAARSVSIRRDVQELNLKALGMTPEKARERFGFFLDALEYGTPPHGGFAAGIERTLCMCFGPKTSAT